MDSGELRARSIRIAGQLGYPNVAELPLLETPLRLRGAGEVVDRTLARYVAVAVSFGFDALAAGLWLEREGLMPALASSELEALSGRSRIPAGVESLWTLCWALTIVDHLDFGEPAQDNFVTRFPNLKVGEDSSEFRRKANLRDSVEVGAELDLAYCLHWAVRDASLRGATTPGSIPADAIAERRHALEWLAGPDAWDATNLDT